MRNTPRTNVRLVKYRNGSLAAFFKRRICYADFAQTLEIETQDLAEALAAALPYIVWSDSEGRHPDDYPEAAAIITATRANAERALAHHRSQQP